MFDKVLVDFAISLQALSFSLRLKRHSMLVNSFQLQPVVQTVKRLSENNGDPSYSLGSLHIINVTYSSCRSFLSVT